MSFQPQNRQYTIRTALGQNFVLDRSQNSDIKKKDQTVIYQSSNSVNQKFNIMRAKDDRYIISSPIDNAVLQVQNCKIHNGAKLYFGPRNNSPNQLWELIPVSKTDKTYNGQPAYYFRSFCGKTLDVYHSKAANDSRVIQYEYHGVINQIWLIQ